MNYRKNENSMSNDERIVTLENTIFSINGNLAEMKTLFIDFRKEMLGNFRELRQEFKQEINSVRQEIGSVRQEVNAFRHEVNGRFESVDRKIESINNRLWSNFLWLMGMIIGLSGLVAHALHWI